VSSNLPPILPPDYQGEPIGLVYQPLPIRAIANIGRLVRAFAEIESCLDCFIQNVGELREDRMMILLGRSPYSAKIKIAKELCGIRTDMASKRHTEIFNEDLGRAQKCRNVVSHGTYIGRTSRMEYAFLTSDAAVSDENKHFLTVYTYSTKKIGAIANWCEAFIPIAEKSLQIESLREKQRAPNLHPHPKAQRKRRNP